MNVDTDLRNAFVRVSQLPNYRNVWLHEDYWALIIANDLAIGVITVDTVSGACLRSALCKAKYGGLPSHVLHNHYSPSTHPVSGAQQYGGFVESQINPTVLHAMIANRT